MVPANLPHIDLLREYFTYNPDTGVLTWNNRSPDSFPTLAGYKIFTRRFAGKPVGSRNPEGYLSISLKGVSAQVHRIAYKLMTGSDPVGLIDHINRDRGDNRWTNLRVVSHRINRLNTKAARDNKLGIKGVMRRGDSYHAHIGVGGKSVHIGTFKDAALAKAAYEGAATVIMAYELDKQARTAQRTPDQSIRSGRPAR